MGAGEQLDAAWRHDDQRRRASSPGRPAPADGDQPACRCTGVRRKRLGNARGGGQASGRQPDYELIRIRCGRITAAGRLDPPQAGVEVILRYVDPLGNVTYRTVITDANGCFEDFMASVTGGTWQVSAEYPGGKCDAPVTEGPITVCWCRTEGAATTSVAVAGPSLPNVGRASSRRPIGTVGLLSTRRAERRLGWYVRDDPMNWVAYHDRTSAYHQAQFDALHPQGWRMISISVYGAWGDERYAAIWVERPGPNWSAVHGVDAAGYQAAFDTNVAAGYLPDLLAATGPANNPVFAGTLIILGPGPCHAFWPATRRHWRSEHNRPLDRPGSQ